MVQNNPPLIPDIFEQTIKANRKSMRALFENKIKFSFLWRIMGLTMQALGNDFLSLFDYSVTPEQLISGDVPTAQYEICQTIIGIHQSKSVFLNDDEIAKNEQNEEYQKACLKEVTLHLAFRKFSAVYYKKKQFWSSGDEFIFFPVPYKLYALCTSALHILHSFSNVGSDTLKSFYDKLFNKALAALTLLEGNFFDSAYPICRAIMELYLKLLMIELYPELLEKYDEYARIEIATACCGRKYPESFNKEFESQKKQYGERVKANFLHFGWVDLLDDYHTLVKQSPYSIHGLLQYLEKKQRIVLDFDGFRFFYKNCHAYTHGTVGTTSYPLLHYFEISIMLALVIPHAYSQMFMHLKNGDNILSNNEFRSTLEQNIAQLAEQYSKRTTEMFEKYYQQKRKLQGT